MGLLRIARTDADISVLILVICCASGLHQTAAMDHSLSMSSVRTFRVKGRPFHIYNRQIEHLKEDQSTKEYIQLKTEVTAVIEKLYSHKFTTRFNRVEDLKFRPRDLSCHFNLRFTSHVEDAEVHTLLQSAINSCYFGPLMVQKNCEYLVEDKFLPRRKLLNLPVDITASPNPSPTYVIFDIYVWLVFKMNFHPQYNKKYSNKWWDLTFAMQITLAGIYRNMPYYDGVVINLYRPGSVLVDYTVSFNISDIDPSTVNLTSLAAEYASKVGTATAKSLLSNSNQLKVNGSDVTVTGSYVFNKDPSTIGNGTVTASVNAITFEELCKDPDLHAQICDGNGTCFTQTLDGVDEQKTLHCDCGDGTAKSNCPVENEQKRISTDNTLWVYPVATVVPLALVMLCLVPFMFIFARRRRRGKDRFIIEAQRSTPTSSSETRSHSTIATRYRPEYGHNWRSFMGPGLVSELPEVEWDSHTDENVQVLHRNRQSQGWTFTEFDESSSGRGHDRDSGSDDSETESTRSGTSYTQGYGYYAQDGSSSFNIPRPFVAAVPMMGPYRLPQMRKTPRMRDGASWATFSSTTDTNNDRFY